MKIIAEQNKTSSLSGPHYERSPNNCPQQTDQIHSIRGLPLRCENQYQFKEPQVPVKRANTHLLRVRLPQHVHLAQLVPRDIRTDAQAVRKV